MPKHAREHDDFVKKFCICYFTKGKGLRPISNAETTYLNKKKTTKTLSKLYSGKIIQRITQTFLPCFAQNVEKSLQELILISLCGRVMKVIINIY